MGHLFKSTPNAYDVLSKIAAKLIKKTDSPEEQKVLNNIVSDCKAQKSTDLTDCLSKIITPTLKAHALFPAMESLVAKILSPSPSDDRPFTLTIDSI